MESLGRSRDRNFAESPTVELVLKKWLKEGQEPRDFYELIDCRRLESRRELLLDAIELANEFFFQCQEHGDAAARKRARECQRHLAAARQILGSRERWQQYDQEVLEKIHSEFELYIKNHSGLTDEQIQDWLVESQSVVEARIEEIQKELKLRIPMEVALLEIDEVDDSDEILLLEDKETPTPHSVTAVARISQTQAPSETLPPRTEKLKPGLKRKFDLVGIDLGTTFSAIAYVDHHGKSQVVCNPEDQQRPILPSAVFFEEGEALIGQTAIDNAYIEPENVVQFVKRSLGERKTFNVGGQSLTPEAVSALILKKLVQIATPVVGPIDRVVITVPAFFNEKRRAATVQCGEIAGLKVEATLNEPSAALIAYGLHTDPELAEADSRGDTPTKNYVVYDLGGGTFDVTVMAVSQNRVKELATGGNRELGGLDWDQALVDYVAKEFQAIHGCSPKESSESLQTLMAECNKAKIQLSSRKRTVVMCTHAGRVHRVEVTREKFEQLTASMLAMTELTVETCLRDAGLEWDEVESVLMVGGSTLMPMVQSMLARISGKTPRSDIDPSTVVAQGAAIYAGVLETQGAIRGAGEHQGASAPEGSPNKSPSGKPQMLPGPKNTSFVVERLEVPDGDDIEVVDLQLVNSHGVGVYATKRGQPVNVVMIPRNSELPTSRTQLFRTTRHDLRELRMRVSEGDSAVRTSCDLLGTCVLGPLPRNLPKGTPVELQIGFSKDGRIKVSADCQGKRIGAEIEARALLTAVQVEEEQLKVARLINRR